jgi:hypothetical protein
VPLELYERLVKLARIHVPQPDDVVPTSTGQQPRSYGIEDDLSDFLSLTGFGDKCRMFPIRRGRPVLFPPSAELARVPGTFGSTGRVGDLALKVPEEDLAILPCARQYSFFVRVPSGIQYRSAVSSAEGEEVGEFRGGDGWGGKGREEGEDEESSTTGCLVVDREEFGVGFDQVGIPGRGGDLRGRTSRFAFRFRKTMCPGERKNPTNNADRRCIRPGR